MSAQNPPPAAQPGPVAGPTDGSAIRPFPPSDTPAVVALWQACGRAVPWNDPLKDIVRTCARQANPFGLRPVAEGSADLRGTVMAGCEGHPGWIHDLVSLGRRLESDR